MCQGGCSGPDWLLGHAPQSKQNLFSFLSFCFLTGWLLFLFRQVGDQDLIETICSALTAAWRFRKWTESRWLTIGSSTRVLVTAVLLGLDSFYQYLKDCVLV